MTAEIINLRRARKQRGRMAADTQAAQNRVSFGRTKVEKSLTGADLDRASSHLSGHRRDRPEDAEPGQ